MTEEDRKRISGYMEWKVKPYWWCEKCKEELEWHQVTFKEDCANCGTPDLAPVSDTKCTDNYEISISSNTKLSGLEKIEPLKIALGSFLGDTFGQETRLAEKLNQVIENQNKIIDYLNQQVKK